MSAGTDSVWARIEGPSTSETLTGSDRDAADWTASPDGGLDALRGDGGVFVLPDVDDYPALVGAPSIGVSITGDVRGQLRLPPVSVRLSLDPPIDVS